MTLEAVMDIINGFSFHGGLRLWNLKIVPEIRPADSNAYERVIQMTFTMQFPCVKCATGLDCGALVTIEQKTTVTAWEAANYFSAAKTLREHVFAEVSKFVMHEMKEAMRWEGEPIQPPHGQDGELL